PFPLRSKDGGRRWRSCTSNLTVGVMTFCINVTTTLKRYQKYTIFAFSILHEQTTAKTRSKLVG
ncbi:hypothetical protein, partial [Bacteroides thetaiotaomicron]|uniref:hypothetical protein n=1 Tax=Bacteroides thetaiotaomicron TaxID=818 RepID=UPI001C38BF0A